MSEQVQKTRGKTESAKAEEAVATKTEEQVKNEEQLKDELDDLLASIDEALGDNLEHAQAFVAAFQQKGVSSIEVSIHLLAETGGVRV